MATYGPPPLFRDKAVVVDYDIEPERAQRIQSSVRQLVRATLSARQGENQLIIGIHDRVAEQGLTAHLVALTSDTIEFSVRDD